MPPRKHLNTKSQCGTPFRLAEGCSMEHRPKQVNYFFEDACRGGGIHHHSDLFGCIAGDDCAAYS